MDSTAPHKEDIKAAIRKSGSTLAAVSAEAGLSKAAGANALNRPVPRANQAIAEFLGKKLHELWPRWYDQNGERIRSARRKPTRKHPPRHRQKTPHKFS
ncbi:helix-turn-helix domain-containing protein [Micavibrio aeruginosavorus]|uniref:helix-turn-helix domain-containing protein n=1 Tax=Micavibrio aeruginosavorus TaxID=349221 RepID=UPI003F4ADE95